MLSTPPRSDTAALTPEPLGDARPLAGPLCTPPPRLGAPCATALSACEDRQR